MTNKQITKKHFIELLATHKNVSLGHAEGYEPQHKHIERMCDTFLADIIQVAQAKNMWRVCAALRTNSITFSDNSSIDFNNKGVIHSYYKIGERVIYEHSEYDNGWCNSIIYILSVE